MMPTRHPTTSTATPAMSSLTPTKTVEQPTESTKATPIPGSEVPLRNLGIEMVLDTVWDEDFASPSSEKHRKLSSDIVTAMASVFRNESRFVGVVVTRFRKGSTIADLQLLHNGGENFDDVATSMLRQASRNGLQVGGARVTGIEQKEEESPVTSGGFDIRWLGFLGVFPVVLIVIAIAIQRQRKRKGKVSIEQRERQ
ncbi:uncharacterized protein [Branchiostoma lanceolatum]|uniref:uncharacterized protein n=1 Tax=Branchiostoma lanceolatum TaxID=7740 RepID=UPI003456F9EA